MPKQPLICVDARMLEASGIGMIIKNVMPHLLDNYNWHLLVNEDSFAVNPWAHHLPHTVVNTPIYTVKEQLFLAQKIPNHADLVWFPHYNVPVTISNKTPFVVNINDCFHRAFYHTLSPAQKLYAKLVMTQAAKRAKRVITISKFSEQQIITYTGIAKSKIDTILLAADTAHFSRFYTVDNIISIRARYKLPEDYILFVGNLKPHKNLIRLLEAYALLKKQDKTKNIKLVLCGNFKGFITGIDDLDQKIQSLGLSDDIHLPGYIADADLPAIYQSAVGFVFPSYYEGFGLPVLEAMAAKIPVVSSNYASLPEVGGDAVIYVDPMKPESIADGLEKVISSPEFCAELVKLGWDQQAKFSWADTATEFKHTFDKVISGN